MKESNEIYQANDAKGSLSLSLHLSCWSDRLEKLKLKAVAIGQLP